MKKKLPFLLGAIVFCCVLAIIFALLFGNPLMAWHNHQLQAALRDLPEGTVTLEEAVPFEWDVLYSFDPYTSREEMENVMHLKSDAVQAGVSEGQRSFVFTKDDKVVCSMYGTPQKLGYDLCAIPSYTVYRYSSAASQQGQDCFLQSGRNAKFAVSHEDDYVKLEYLADQSIMEDREADMQIFEYQNLRLGITDVREVRTEVWTDVMGDSQERPVYVCEPGAVIMVLHADMEAGADDGVSYARWKIYLSDTAGSWNVRVSIVDDMAPFAITENTRGIGAEDEYILRFEMVEE